MKRVFVAAAVALLSIFAFISCEVGLGSAVDTFPPEISIQVPSDSFVVRDNFVMSGTISDDMGVTGLSVVLTESTSDNSKGRTYSNFRPVFDNEKGTWSCEINPISYDEDGNLVYNILDGTYTATVVAKDSFDHKTTVTRTFTIDNTAPLIVLSSPSTVDITSGTVYGQNFYLDGIVADDNAVDTIDVLIYDENNNPALEESAVKRTITLENASSLEQVSVMKWNAQVRGAGLLNDYNEVYGTNPDDGAKYFYFTLESHDTARKIPADENDRGNTTKIFYFYDDIGDSVLKTYKPSGTYHITNGTYESSSSGNGALEYAKQSLVENKKTQGTFQLNPRNNPTFKLSGYDPVEDYSDTEKANPLGVLKNLRGQFSLGTTLSITFERGRDNYSLMPETFGVYLVKADDFGNVLTGSEAVTHTLVAPYFDYDENGNWVRTEAGKANPGRDYDECITQTGTTYTAGITIPNADGYEGCYWLKVVGYDKNGMFDDQGIKIKDRGVIEMDNSSSEYPYKYALWLIGNASAPSLGIEQPAVSVLNVPKETSILIKGNASDTTGQNRNIVVRIYTNDTNRLPAKEIKIKNSGNFEYTLPAEVIAKAAGNADPANPDISSDFQLYVVVSDPESGLSTERAFTISYDCTAPEFKTVSVSPMVTLKDELGVSTDYVNGEITIKANVTDNKMVTTCYSLDGGKTKEEVANIGSGFTVNTAEKDSSGNFIFADNNDSLIKLYAKDTAGNETVKDIILHINQSTDIPVITASNFDSTLAAEEDFDVENQTNIFKGSSNKLMGTVEDDDGLESVTVTYYKNGEKISAPATYGLKSNPVKVNLTKGTTTASLEAALPTVTGVYEVEIEAIDVVNENADYNKNKIGKFVVAIDRSAPTLKETKVNTDSVKYINRTTGEILFSGEAADDWGVHSLTVTETKGDVRGEAKAIEISEGKWTYRFDGTEKEDDDYVLEFEITDKAGNTKNVTRNICVDKTAPLVKEWGIKSTGVKIGEDDWYKTNLIGVELKEENKDIASVEVSADNVNWINFTAGDENEGVQNWSATVTIEDEGKNTIYLKLTDQAGNVSTARKIIYVDTKAPSECTASITDTLMVNGSEDLVFTVNTHDYNPGSEKEYSDLEKVKLTKIGNLEINDIAGIPDEETVGQYTITIPKERLNDTCNGTVVVNVYDKAGNKSTDFTLFQLKYDGTAPVVEIGSITPTRLSKDSSENDRTCVNGTVTITGSVNESNLDHVYYEVYSGDSETPVIAKTDLGAAYSFNISVNTGDSSFNISDEDDFTIVITAVDKARNQHVYSTTDKNGDSPLYVKQSTDKPVITLSNADSSILTAEDIAARSRNIFGSSNNKLIGTITDDDGFVSGGITVKVEKLNSLGNVEGTPLTVEPDCSDTTSYSLSVDIPTSAKCQYRVTIFANDNKGETGANSKSQLGPFLIVVDEESPVFDSISVNDQVYSSSQKLYVHSGKTTAVTGKVTDDSNRTIKLVRYDGYDESTENYLGEETEIIPSADGTWTDSFESDSVAAACYYVASDLYGKTSEQIVKYEIDDIEPLLSGTNTTIGGKVSTELASADTWFKTTDLTIDGRYDEAGSGIKSIEYWIALPGQNYSVEKTGTISPADKGTYETFKGSFSVATSAGTNHSKVKIKATDYAGNSSENEYIIRVDGDAPVPPASFKYEIEGSAEKAVEDTILVNGTKNLKLSGSASDGASGVNNIKLIVDSTEYDVIENGTYGNSEWSYTIPAEDLSSLEEAASHSVKVKVTDKAGNTDTSNSIVIKLDQKPPVYSLKTPSADSKLNGNVNFTGTLTDADNNKPKSIAMYYKVAATAPASLSEMTKGGEISTATGEIDVTQLYSWSFTQNVSSLLSGDNTSGKLFVAMDAFDEAGNESPFAVKEYKIDLDSDRPLLKLNNIPTPVSGEITYLANINSLSVTVTDDDGVDFIKILNQASEPTSAQWTAAAEITSGTGTYAFDLGSDGAKKLWFYIKDNAGGVFITKDSKAIKQPKIAYSNSPADTYGANGDGVSFTIDSSKPALSELKFGYASTNSAAAAKENLTALGNTNIAGGSTRKYIILSIKAASTGSGIKTVKANLNGTDYAMTTTGSTGIYYSDVIDASTFGDGAYQITFTAVNNTEIESKETKNITVDNSAPVPSLSNPSSTDEVTGIITLIGSTYDDYSAISAIKFVIGSDVITSEADAMEKAKDAEYTCTNSGSSANSWKFVLNGTANPKITTDISKLTGQIGTSDVYNLPVYIYTLDELGNEAVTSTTIKYNPFGDRPSASLTYPIGVYATEEQSTAEEKKAYVDGYSNLSGSVRITGAAEDNEAIGEGKVYIQLDVNNDGKFNKDDLTILKGLVSGGKADYVILEDAANIPGKTDISVLGGSAAELAFWGILVNGTNSWNYTVNSNNELQLDSALIASGKYKLGVRAIAMDNKGVLGKWGEGNYFMIDLNAPSIDSASLVTDITDANEIPQSYESDMYLRGTKYLRLKISDITGLRSVKYTYAERLEDLNTIGITETAELGSPKLISEKKVYTVDIPLSQLVDSAHLNSTAVALKVVATKDSDTETTTYEKYNVFFDNTAPAIKTLTLNSIEYEESEKKIVNSNGYFTIGGSASDEGAGFERMSFYFMREPGTTINETRIYDPMIASVDGLSSQLQPNYISIAGLDKKVINLGTEADPENYTIYGKEMNASIVSSTVLSVSGVSTDSHIREGSYVLIGDTWHKVSQISGSSVTIANATAASGSQTVFFAYMQTIDNTGTEKSDGAGGVSSGDDGDTMPESIVKSQTTWTYDASFFSNYIPDGPGYLVVFVYDKAGNVSAKKYAVSVQNKAPRLTKLYLATDLNSSGDFQDISGTTELVEYNVLSKVGEQTNYKEMKTSDYRGERFIIKNNLAVIPEFTNGNGTIYMAYNNAPAGTEPTVFADKTAADVALYKTNPEKVPDLDALALARSGDSKWAYIISNDDLGAGSYNELTKMFDDRAMSFTFWDSTEDTISGVNSNYCYLKITDLVVNVEDVVGPNVTIDPFFWKSHEDNSLFENSYTNGHIELADDEDPKVSGKISIRGTAFDDHTLDSIWIKFDAFTPDTDLYDGDADDDGYYKLASYDGSWTSYAQPEKVDGNQWKFTVTPEYLGQKGHKVNWQLDIDTSAISGAMGADKKVYVRALDEALTPHVSSDESNGELTDGDDVYNKPDYQMDVVPYISGIYSVTNAELTAVGWAAEAGKEITYTEAPRSRLGRYPVRAGNPVALKGFNFGTGTISVTKTIGATKQGVSSESWTSNATRIDANTIIISAPQYSGYVNLKIGDTTASNNQKETYAGYNIEEGYVATDAASYGKNAANKNGTNFWTDDRYLSVWRIGDYFDQSFNPISGTVEKFDNAGSKFMQGQNYDTSVTANSLLGVWASNDKMMHDAILAEGKSRQNNICHSANNVFANPPDDTDVLMLDNIPFYSILDNGVDGSGGWKGGIMILQDGQTYQTASNGAALVLEMQGDDNIETPDSSDGKDEKLYQFQNPKIAGYDDAGYYYVYTTYYDTYAHCLKYGEVQFEKKTQNGIKQPGSFTVLARTYDREEKDNSTNGKFVIAGYDTTITDGKVTGGVREELTFREEAGQWNDIKIYNKKPVVVYYNKTTGSLQTAYGMQSTPETGRMHTSAGYSIASGAATTGWYYNELSNPAGVSDFGRYVSMEIDDNGGLHIVAQDVDNSILYYGYVSAAKYQSAQTGNVAVTWQKVDATSSVGRWTDIKLEAPAGTSGKTDTAESYKPIITYMDTAFLNTTKAIKVAYMTADGWESMTDPAQYEACDEKLSIVSAALDNGGNSNRIAVGINSNLLAVDFLRDEK